MIKEALANGVIGLLLMLDGIVYWLLSKLFSLYVALAGAEIIKEDFFTEIINRFYVVVGVFMLFVVAYSLLKSLINPDNLTKDTGKIVTNVIISIILIGIVPIIFNYARDLQNIIIEENIIGNILLNEKSDSIEQAGNNIALQVLTAFVDMDDSVVGNLESPYNTDHVTWGELKDFIREGHNANFRKISYFAESINEGEGNASYLFILSTICGGFLIYVVLSFCIDLGIRVIKIAFYQIIAPIPILLRIIPEKKSVFDNWVKASLATYMEVFIRMFIIALISVLCTEILNGNMLELNNTNSDLGLFGKVIVVLGIFAFARQAPKLIGDVLGLDSGKIKLGIAGKLATSGAFGIGAMLGGGVTTGIRNVTHGVNKINGGWNKFHETKGQGFSTRAKAFGSFAGTTVKSVLYTPFSGLGGILGGGVQSAKDGFAAKTYKDVAKAAGEGTAKAITKRNEREAYRASEGLWTPIAHIDDALVGFGKWLGFNSSAEGLKKTLDVYQQGFDFKKKLEDLALKKSTQAKVYDQQIDALNQAAIKREDFRTEADYSDALIARAEQIDKLKDAKTFEIMKEINKKLGNLSDPKNAEYAEIVTSFDTYKRQNANLLSGIKDLTNAGWNPAWDSINPLNMSPAEIRAFGDLHDLVKDMKKDFRYMENHTKLEKNKNETARAYAEFMQKENEKK